jgi:hypothetical protein
MTQMCILSTRCPLRAVQIMLVILAIACSPASITVGGEINTTLNLSILALEGHDPLAYDMGERHRRLCPYRRCKLAKAARGIAKIAERGDLDGVAPRSRALDKRQPGLFG